MIIRKEIDFNEPLSPEQIKMLEEMENNPSVPDEECPELSDEQLSKVYRASDRKKFSVIVRLSPQSIEKAEALGSNYPSVLSKLLETILNNNDLLKQCI